MKPSYTGWWTPGATSGTAHHLEVVVAGEALTTCGRALTVDELRPWVATDDRCRDCVLLPTEGAMA